MQYLGDMVSPSFYGRSEMTDWEKLELAFDILESAEVMHEFDDCLWISVDKEMYLQLNGGTTQGETQ